MANEEAIEVIMQALRPMVVDLVRQSERLRRDSVPSAASRRSVGVSDQQASLEHASRSGRIWTGAEISIAMRDDLSILEIARMLNRSKYAVTSIRKSRRRADWI